MGRGKNEAGRKKTNRSSLSTGPGIGGCAGAPHQFCPLWPVILRLVSSSRPCQLPLRTTCPAPVFQSLPTWWVMGFVPRCASQFVVARLVHHGPEPGRQPQRRRSSATRGVELVLVVSFLRVAMSLPPNTQNQEQGLVSMCVDQFRCISRC